MSIIRIETSAEPSLGMDAKVTDAKTGADLGRMIRGIIIKVEPCDLVTAEVQMAVQLSLTADASWLSGDPGTGEIKPVRRIEFADGSVWEAED